MPDFVANAVTKEFDTPAGPLRILDGVSTKLDRGQNMAVIGDSGSGKSTFLHIAGTLDSPTSGEVCLMGSDLTELNENQLAHFRNENIGFIFQEHHLLPHSRTCCYPWWPPVRLTQIRFNAPKTYLIRSACPTG